MNPAVSVSMDRVVMGDLYVAVGTALLVGLIFAIAAFAQRRRPAASPLAMLDGVPLVHPTPALGELIDGRLAEALGPMEERQKKTEHDVNNIRASIQALASRDDVHKVEIQATKTDGQVGALVATVAANQRSLERIENFLINGGGRS